MVLSNIAYIFGARLEFDGEDVKPEDMRTYEPPKEYKLNRTARGGDTAVSTDGNPLYLTRSFALDTWLKQLAKDYNSAYEVFEDPIVGIPVIRFTAKKLRFEKVIQTLNYRSKRNHARVPIQHYSR